MRTRTIGRTGWQVSAVGLGCWQLGADWGAIDEADGERIVAAALDEGITFLDTADVYGDGRSERIVGRAIASWSGPAPIVATKMGRRAQPHVPESYTAQAFRAWLDRSRSNLGVDTIDLVQLHTPPTPVFHDDRVFDALDQLVDEQVIRAYGVSVETCQEALTAIARPGVASVQIIINAFRLRPLDEVLPAAAQAGVGIVVRVPLASGLLSGRYTAATTFGADDHRTYNRNGEAFDAGETFSGVPYEVGVAAAREFAQLAPSPLTPAQTALAWLVDRPGVTTVIPGASSVEQVHANAAVGSLPPLDSAIDSGIHDIYDRLIREHVHGRW
jgi:aryl-alcohol dehydrogenase-like predicted oxidoreductase